MSFVDRGYEHIAVQRMPGSSLFYTMINRMKASAQIYNESELIETFIMTDEQKEEVKQAKIEAMFSNKNNLKRAGDAIQRARESRGDDKEGEEEDVDFENLLGGFESKGTSSENASSDAN